MPWTETSPVKTFSSPLSVRTMSWPSASTSMAVAAARAAARQIEGDVAAQVDAGRLVLVPEGSKALPREGVERTVKAEVRQSLGQPLGVGGKVHFRALQFEGGAVGQVCGVEIALGLCQIDADAADDAPALHAGSRS